MEVILKNRPEAGIKRRSGTLRRTWGLLFDYSVADSPLIIKQQTEKPLAGITLYPNPSNGYFTISAVRPFTGILEISNLFGQVLMRMDTNQSTNETLDISNLANDMYFVQLKGNQNFNTKIIKK